MSSNPPPAVELQRWFFWGWGEDKSQQPLQRLDHLDRSYSAVIHAWTEPGRVYHSLTRHLIPLIDRIRLRQVSDYWERVAILGAFYHDVVMDFTKSDSENVHASVEMFREHAAVLTPNTDAFVADVIREIASTNYSNPQSLEEINGLLRSCDLESLGGNWGTFRQNGVWIAEERPESKGRESLQAYTKWIIQLLMSPRIYIPGAYWDEIEVSARENLGRELALILNEHPDVLI